jgi:cytochrome c oxidase cbb3-type subunit 3
MSDRIDKLLDHECDGIQEYDNPSPGWWLGTFYGAVLFSICYMFYYGMNFGGDHVDELNAAQVQHKASVQAWFDENPMVPPTAEELLAGAVDPEVLAAGDAAYQKQCASCHGVEGQGLIGPNLTDDHWLHGGSVLEIFDTIVKGVPDKGMPTWGRRFAPEDLEALASYVRSLHGTNPADAKSPQGELAEVEPLPGDESAEPTEIIEEPEPTEG